MADATYQPKVYRKQGGDTFIIASGGDLDVESGGALKIGGTDKTTILANALSGTSAAQRVAFGRHVTVAATDTVVTGLTTVESVVVSLEALPVIGCAGAFAATSATAGSIIIGTFKPTASGDATPIAATTFTKGVFWFAKGT